MDSWASGESRAGQVFPTLSIKGSTKCHNREAPHIQPCKLCKRLSCILLWASRSLMWYHKHANRVEQWGQESWVSYLLSNSYYQPTKPLPEMHNHFFSPLSPENVFKTYSNLMQSKSLMTRTLILASNMNRRFIEEHIQMANKQRKAAQPEEMSGNH